MNGNHVLGVIAKLYLLFINQMQIFKLARYFRHFLTKLFLASILTKVLNEFQLVLHVGEN